MRQISLIFLLCLLTLPFVTHAQVHDHFDRKQVLAATCDSAHVSARLVQNIGVRGTEFYLQVKAGGEEIKSEGPLPRLRLGQTLDLQVSFPEQPEGTSLSIEVYYKSTYSPYVVFDFYSCASATSPDSDADEIANQVDNCPYTYNPNQEDEWGSEKGNVCDGEIYDQFRVKQGYRVYGYPMHDGTLLIHANCGLGYICTPIAQFRPDELVSDAESHFQHENSHGWYVEVYYLGPSTKGENVYQVNTYAQDGTLIDDRMEIHMNKAGKWHLKERGQGRTVSVSL